MSPSVPPAPAPPPPPLLPADWPTEPAKPDETARPPSQLAVLAVCAGAIAIVCGATGTLTWGVAAIVALGGGAAISMALEGRRLLGSLPGAAAAAITMLTLTVVLAFVGGPPSSFALMPVAGAFVLGLDWQLVRRLRPLPFGFGFLVVCGVAGGQTWTYPAALVWLAGALGALALLESDRRAAQPQVEPVTTGPVSSQVRTTDLATTVLVALAVAVVAALVLSTPSCRPPDQDPSGRSGSGSPGSFGEPGSGSGSGSESGGPGGGSGSGSGQGSGADDHLYVPDPDGRYLIPDNGEGGSGSTTGIPSPELLPDEPGPPSTQTAPDGTEITAERYPDGTGRITVVEPDGTERTYTYRERSDGLIEIQEEGGEGRTLLYDPQGRLATDEDGLGGAAGSDQADDPQEEDDGASPPDWRILALVAAVLAALGALAWWLSRRTKPVAPMADAPPWALRLATEIGRAGAARGRPRNRSEPLVGYAAALRSGPIPDERIVAVADVVSTALFSRGDPGPEAQRWAEATWEEIESAHPAPGRAERRRADAGAR